MYERTDPGICGKEFMVFVQYARVKNQGNAAATVHSAGRFYYSETNSFTNVTPLGSLADLQPMSPGEEHPETIISLVLEV